MGGHIIVTSGSIVIPPGTPFFVFGVVRPVRNLAELDEHASRLPVTSVGVLDPYFEITRAQTAVLVIVFLLPAHNEIPRDKLGSIVVLHESNKRALFFLDPRASNLEGEVSHLNCLAGSYAWELEQFTAATQRTIATDVTRTVCRFVALDTVHAPVLGRPRNRASDVLQKSSVKLVNLRWIGLTAHRKLSLAGKMALPK